MFLSRILPAFLIVHLVFCTPTDNSTVSPKPNQTESYKHQTNSTPTVNVTESIATIPKQNLENVLEGGKVSFSGTVKISSTTETTRPYGREHVTEGSTVSKVNIDTTTETVISVGNKTGNTTLGVKNNSSVITTMVSSSTQVTSGGTGTMSSTDGVKMTNESISSTTEKVIPISEVVDMKMDNKKTVPKKGVNFTETLENMTFNKSTLSNLTSSTTPTPSTRKPIPKKPLITVSTDEEPFAPSHFVPGKTNGTNQKVPSIESFENSNRSGPDYIVPIVGVILSVPLVAILLNAVYKRTKEWWHHRHYSRMDFLIDGMYNN